MLYHPIYFGLVVPDATPKITRARSHLKYVTCPELLYILRILWMYYQYALGRFEIISVSRALAC